MLLFKNCRFFVFIVECIYNLQLLVLLCNHMNVPPLSVPPARGSVCKLTQPALLSLFSLHASSDILLPLSTHHVLGMYVLHSLISLRHCPSFPIPHFPLPLSHPPSPCKGFLMPSDPRSVPKSISCFSFYTPERTLIFWGLFWDFFFF